MSIIIELFFFTGRGGGFSASKAAHKGSIQEFKGQKITFDWIFSFSYMCNIDTCTCKYKIGFWITWIIILYYIIIIISNIFH